MMKNSEVKNIRFKLLAPFIASIIIILLSNLWNMYIFQQDSLREFSSSTTKQLYNNFNEAIKADIELFESSLYFISHNPLLQELWIEKNRDAIIAESTLIYEKLKQDHHVTHFYFHDINAINYLRVHKPNRHSDIIKRASLTEAITSQKISANIEFGTLGQFVLRAVIPWEIEGEIVGYIELGEEIDHILKRISVENKYDLILAVKKEYLYENNLENAEYFLNHKTELSQDNNSIILNKTSKEIHPRVIELLNTPKSNDETLYKSGDETILVAKLSIEDPQKNSIVSLAYIMDVTEHVRQSKSLLMKTIWVSLLLGLFVLNFYFLYSKKLQKSLLRNKNKLIEIIKERDEHLEESKKRYQTLFDKTADALLIIDNNKIIDCNQSTLNMLGYETKQQLIESPPSKLSPIFQSNGDSSKIKANEMITIAIEKGSHRFEWEHVRKNGQIFPVEVLLTAIPLKDVNLMHVVWRDITQQKKVAAALEKQAYYDILTKLPNRRLLLDRLKQALITSQRHDYYGAVLFIDLDRFKGFNDALGHVSGDLLLIEAAKRIETSIRDEDTVSRFGGDEFVVLLKNVGTVLDNAGIIAKKIATKIQCAFNKSFIIQGHELQITLSVGIAMFPFNNQNVEDVIKNADTAMYDAKENGRNQISFYMKQMHKQVLKRLTMEKDLHNAINKGELDIFYQPQLDGDGKVVTLEALIRWKHPEFGFVDPEYLIAMAEDTGFIYEIGDFVLNKSIKDIQNINQEFNSSINLSINISVYQFRQENFVKTIENLIKQYNIEENFLTLEVTEHIAIDNFEETIEKFEEIRCLGVRLSLDDFGTGYSSLNYLKRLPLNELKIDKSFVFDIESDPQVALLVKSIIQISHQFGLFVVAEGVETTAQLQFLLEEECDVFQGFHFCHPITKTKLHSYLSSHQLKS